MAGDRGRGRQRAGGRRGDRAGVRLRVRAAVAEAAGEFVAVRPKTTAGVEAEPRTAVKPAAPEAKEKEKEKPVASGDLPHNQEAASMLNQARVYLKTGRKTDAKKLLQEIVEKYPGTWEAKDAQETLDARFSRAPPADDGRSTDGTRDTRLRAVRNAGGTVQPRAAGRDAGLRRHDASQRVRPAPGRFAAGVPAGKRGGRRKCRPLFLPGGRSGADV